MPRPPVPSPSSQPSQPSRSPRPPRRWRPLLVALLTTSALGLQTAGVPVAASATAAPQPACTITGTPRSEVLVGTPGDDVICGGGGNDRIDGAGGDDVLRAGSGNDVLVGGEGDDRLDAGAGNDVLDGGLGSDELLAGEGNDRVTGGAGADALSGGAGNDALDGGSGGDALDGAEGNDRLTGGSGPDALAAGAGNDQLSGGSGDDRLDGGADRDGCDGGTGTNTHVDCERSGDDPAPDPDLADGDRDGLDGVAEQRLGGDPALADTDGDGLTDGEELLSTTDLGARDSDGDGVLDGDDDADGDGLPNAEEVAGGTKPYAADTDGEGLDDAAERALGTDPLRPDTDGDGLTDAEEDALGSDPLATDGDGDGTPDGEETYDRTVALPGGSGVVLEARGTGAAVLDVELAEVTDTELVDVPGQRAPPVSVGTGRPLAPSTLTIPFDPSTVTPGARLAVLHYDEATGTFDRPADQEVDLAAGVARVTTDDFSPFVLVEVDEFERVWAEEITVPREGSGGAAPIDTAVVLDSSGSMQWNDPSGARRTAGKAFVDALLAGDRAAVVDFDDWATVLQALTADLDAVKDAIDEIDSIGGTNIAAGLRAALDQLDALGEPGRGRVVLLLTDGEGYYDPALTTRAQQSGTTVYTVGLGSSVDRRLLESIATATGGRYFQVDRAEELVDTFERIGGDLGAPDTDGDGLADAAETGGMRTGSGRTYTSDPARADTDGDGLPDGAEMGALSSGGSFGAGSYYRALSDPRLADTDGDGLDDAQEQESGTHPRLRDSDGDGLEDLTELSAEFDPTDMNPDGDLLFDDEEYAEGSDPFLYDLDTSQSVHAALSGFAFGDAWDSTFARWAGVDVDVASATWYLVGSLASGYLVVGDLRDLLYGVATGAWGDAALAAVAFVPALGDAAKTVGEAVGFARKSGRAAQSAVAVVASSGLPRQVIDQVVVTVARFASPSRLDGAVRGRAAPSANFDIASGTWAGAKKRISRDPAQARALDDLLDDLVRRQAAGDSVLDVRVNQRQVGIDGRQLGINRPDLQYTLNGERYYVELDRPRCSDPGTTRRGETHVSRILTNDKGLRDPLAQAVVLIVGACE